MKLKFEYQNQLTRELTVSLAKVAGLPAETVLILKSHFFLPILDKWRIIVPNN
jgi:hypothetical protein